MRGLYFGLDPSRFLFEGTLVHLPLIKTVAFSFTDESIQNVFNNLLIYSHVIFTSRTAVQIYIEYAQKAGYFLSNIKNQTYFAIGEGTAAILKDFQLDNIKVAQHFTAEGILDLLTQHSWKNCLYPHSQLARPLIKNYLNQRNLPYSALELYTTVANEVTLPDLQTFDKLIFTSPSTVEAFKKLINRLPPFEKCLAIGSITQNALEMLFARKNSAVFLC